MSGHGRRRIGHLPVTRIVGITAGVGHAPIDFERFILGPIGGIVLEIGVYVIDAGGDLAEIHLRRREIENISVTETIGLIGVIKHQRIGLDFHGDHRRGAAGKTLGLENCIGDDDRIIVMDNSHDSIMHDNGGSNGVMNDIGVIDGVDAQDGIDGVDDRGIMAENGVDMQNGIGR